MKLTNKSLLRVQALRRVQLDVRELNVRLLQASLASDERAIVSVEQQVASTQAESLAALIRGNSEDASLSQLSYISVLEIRSKVQRKLALSTKSLAEAYQAFLDCKRELRTVDVLVDARKSEAVLEQARKEQYCADSLYLIRAIKRYTIVSE